MLQNRQEEGNKGTLDRGRSAEWAFGWKKNSPRESFEYKSITKQINKRVRRLRNEKLSNEAKKINEFATRREVEELYHAFKSDNSSFKDTKPSKKCDPSELRDFFKGHFTSKIVDEDAIELKEIPDYIKPYKISQHKI